MSEQAGSLQEAVDDMHGMAGEDAPRSIRVTLSTGPLTLSQQDLKGLSWDQHIHIWKVPAPPPAPLQPAAHSAHTRLLEVLIQHQLTQTWHPDRALLNPGHGASSQTEKHSCTSQTAPRRTGDMPWPAVQEAASRLEPDPEDRLRARLGTPRVGAADAV